MAVVNTEDFNRLLARVSSLEGGLDSLAAQLDDDAKNNAGALTDNYADKGAAGNDQYTVTNLKNALVRFTDGNGSSYQLGVAGGPDEAATATGLSAEMSQLETDGVVSIVAV